MNGLEIIRIRLFRVSDGDQVMTLFEQFKEKIDGFQERDIIIALMKNKAVENDWSIHLVSVKRSANKKVSGLVALLTETFRTIGMVNHDTWEPWETIK